MFCRISITKLGRTRSGPTIVTIDTLRIRPIRNTPAIVKDTDVPTHVPQAAAAPVVKNEPDTADCGPGPWFEIKLALLCIAVLVALDIYHCTYTL
jgi:hypothetical protein